MKIPGSGRVSTLSAPVSSALGWLVALGIRPTIRRSGRVSPGWAKPPHWPSSWSLKAGSSPSSCNRRSVARILQTRTPVPSGCAGCQRSSTRSGSSRSQPRFLARRCLVPASRSAPNSPWRHLPISRMRSSALELGRWRCRRPPEVVTKNDVGEATLCHLDGTPFRAPTKLGGEVVRRLSQWGQSVIGAAERPLVVSLIRPMNPMPGMCGCWPTTTTTGLIRSRSHWPQVRSRRRRRRRAARTPRASVPAAVASRRTTTRRGDPVSGRGVGPDDRRR